MLTLSLEYDEKILETMIDSSQRKVPKAASVVEKIISSVATSAVEDKQGTEYKSAKLNNYKTGDVIKFGKFKGKTIEWQVLQAKGNKLLVVSMECLEGRGYHSSAGSVTWETSTIRQYLYTEFINKCFSKSELNKICMTNVNNKGNALMKILGRKETRDRVFLLSVDEAEELFNSTEARKCNVAEYARKNTSGWWLLRSPGYYDNETTYVSDKGVIMTRGYNVRNPRGAVRPAMWLEVVS